MTTEELNIDNLHPEEELSIQVENIDSKKFKLTKTIMLATVAFIGFFLVSPFLCCIASQYLHCNVSQSDVTHVYLEIIPFWATITGTVLGHYFLSNKSQ